MTVTDRASDAEPSDHTDVVAASPTKEFFVRMLVRDIELLPAIVDLVDNSVDGARRLREGRGFKGLWVHVIAKPDSFQISDNCGGIPLEIARQYAFRLGRDPNAKGDPHSIGQFGVGMKRALFKLGNNFSVESRTIRDSFRLDVNVSEWLTRPDEWDLPLSKSASGERRRRADTGTDLVVTDLHPEVRTVFGDRAWQSQLAHELRLKHRDALIRGLRIEINGKPVEATELDLIDAEPFRPGQSRFSVGQNSGLVNVSIVVGVSGSQPEAGGWYVFCNGRMVLGPDQTSSTVWLGKGNQGLPKYHDEYARFRGFTFFEAEDAAALPWTTTKVGIDQDSRIWQGTREKMIEMSKPVIRFLRVLDRQRDAGNESVYEKLTALKPVPLERVETTDDRPFESPPMELPDVEPSRTRITYYQDRDLVAVAKNLLGVTTNEKVGELTFDYFMDAEGESR